jgi:imidazole glycerol-phosphate synthase subunit HisF
MVNRLIPCLLLRNNGLVKTKQFGQTKYVGDPINALRIFNDKAVDELIVLDIQVGKERKEPNYELIGQFAGECFMPLAYGGGITSVDQARRIFALGVEKICVQTAALQDLDFVAKLAQQFGNQSIVVVADIKKNWLGKYKLLASSTSKTIDLPWQKFLEQAALAGAGELVVQAVDRDGLRCGLDLALIKEAATLTQVPLIAMGGLSGLNDFSAAIQAGANAVAGGAFFVFQGPHEAVLITYPNYVDIKAALNY